MPGMLDLNELAGLVGAANVGKAASPDNGGADKATIGWRAPDLVQGSVIAQVVADVYAGSPVTIVKSPPGGGKTHLLGVLASWLAGFGGLRVGVATFTREQRNSVAERLAATLDDGMVRITGSAEVPENLRQLTRNRSAKVHVSTCASLTAGREPVQYDVLLVDEAYQLPFDEVACAAANSAQIVLVGDPGQIGPVITADTTSWEQLRVAPHRPSPHGFQNLYGLTPAVHTLDATWRLGAVTTEVIAPLYSFPFASARPPMHVSRKGETLPEVAHVTCMTPATIDDTAMMNTVVNTALGHIGDTFVADGQERMITASDIAIVVSRSTQVTKATALLRAGSHSRVTVGTADKLQGGQWPVVVALDPVTGAPDLGSHQVALGRTCVMLSRHQARLVWVHDGTSVQRMLTARAERSAIAVRQKILAQPGA